MTDDSSGLGDTEKMTKWKTKARAGRSIHFNSFGKIKENKKLIITNDHGLKKKKKSKNNNINNKFKSFYFLYLKKKKNRGNEMFF